jgi:HlyD family secretion protein
MRRFITIVIVIAILAGAGYAFWRWRQQQQQATQASSYQTETATVGQLIATIGATGQVRPNQTSTLSWKTSGTVQDVNVKVGDMVKAGDKLADLEQTSLPQNIILAQADLVNAKQALDDLYTNIENSKVQSLQAISNAAKAAKDAQYQLDNFTIPENQMGLSTMQAIDQMKQKLDAARAAFEPYKYYPSTDKTRQDLKDKLDQAQSDYNAAVKRLDYEYAVEVAQANLDKARKDYDKYSSGPSADDIAAAKARIAASEATLSQAWIEAPFQGTLTQVNPRPGDQVAPNSAAFRLDDLTKLLVDLSVSEIDINQISAGQPVTLTFDAIRNKEYHGKVTDVDSVGTLNQGVVDFQVTVELTDADQEVKPGMTAAVNVVVNQLKDVLLVPNRAVRFRDSKQVVYILKDGQLTPVDITLGASSDVVSEVLGGLQAGDVIVLNPPTVFDQNGPPPFARQR